MNSKNLEISKTRLKKVGTREKRSAVATEPVRFRNSTALAMFYVLLTMAFATGMLAWAYPSAKGDGWYKQMPVAVLIMVVAISCTRIMLGLIARDILKRNSRILMLCIVAMLSIFFSAAELVIVSMPAVEARFPFDVSPLTHFLFPFIFAPAMATLLAGPAAGVSLGIGMMFFNLLFSHSESLLPAFATSAIVAVITPRLVMDTRKRVALLRAFVIVGWLQVLGIAIFLGLKLAFRDMHFTWGGATAFAGIATILSAGSAFAATVVVLPFLEHIFAASSNIRLNEFTDLGNPLLQRLSLEAPGTYHHCIVVATLAAAAAERIGANSLLARVGSYYHDIGKLTKPSFYAENVGYEHQSPHSQITPNMSAVIIAAHVKEGIGMAIHHNLPPPVRDIIREHHGTSIMTWFHHKAQEEARARAAAENTQPDPVDESQFRYPGPRPSTKESGIVLLADCVEAASRTLDRPSPANIENLVENIVAGKIKDEQLDNCPLTFIDIACIKRTFTITLSNILHARVPYPKQEDSKGSRNEAEDAHNAPADRH